MIAEPSPFERRLIEELRTRFPAWGRAKEARSVAGGLSGARVYQIASEGGAFAVKLSPFDPQRLAAAKARLEAIEAIAAFDAVAAFGPKLFPRIARDRTGAGVWRIEIEGETWQGEASEWLTDGLVVSSNAAALAIPGESGSASVRSAFYLLARFHAAAKHVRLSPSAEAELRSSTPLPERYVREWNAVAPPVLERIRSALPTLEPSHRALVSAYLNRLPTRVASARAALESLSAEPPSLCLCLRDVHRKNVRFQGERAVSFFDWDALRFDRRIGDFARLAASYGLRAGETEELIDDVAAEAPETERLSAWEQTALRPALATQIWIPPLRWLTWLVVERREFPDPAAARERFRETLELALREPFGAEET